MSGQTVDPWRLPGGDRSTTQSGRLSSVVSELGRRSNCLPLRVGDLAHAEGGYQRSATYSLTALLFTNGDADVNIHVARSV